MGVTVSAIPVQNLYHMLAYAWERLEDLEPRDLVATPHPHAAGVLSGLLVRSVQRVVRQGLDRDYRSFGIDTRQPRGRIDVAETARRMLRPTGQIHCEIDERVIDLPPHRAIKAALRTIAWTPEIDASIQEDAQLLLRHFAEVATVPLSPGLVARAREQGQHRRLRMPLQICGLLARLLLPEPGVDGTRLLDLRRDDVVMRKIFETFVRRFCERHSHDGVKVERHSMRWHGLAPKDASRMPMLVPDVVLRSGHHWLVIECKFTPAVLVPHRDRTTYQPEHVRQLMAYVANLQRRNPGADVSGLLVYAQGSTSVDDQLRVWNADVRIATLDLGAVWPALEARLAELVGARWLSCPSAPPPEAARVSAPSGAYA